MAKASHSQTRPAAPPTLALTVGDPAGIGPEIALKAVKGLRPRIDAGEMRLLLLTAPDILIETGRRLGLPVPPTVSSDDPADWPGAVVIEASPVAGAIRVGEVTPEAGRQAYEAVALAVRMALAGTIAGIVTAPLNKEALHLAGFDYAGHTEMLAALTGVKGSVMMLAHEDFRVTHVTTHIALEDVPKRATPDRMTQVIDLTLDVLRRLGIKQPRVAVAALNPHAGEGGAFGRHDIDVTAPLVAGYRKAGEEVSGPVPGDTVFVKLRARQYDAVIAMYHDQGHIPVKLLGFSVDPQTGEWMGLSGVNVTLGLPIIRTSVDHGTAFDIAGRGIANETSLIEAVDYALRLAGSGTSTDRRAPAAA
ncbi:MAG: 4-hydroxythreonine-4-phosphate dehydrogenase PdxA [Inquilinaceae bacterium]